MRIIGQKQYGSLLVTVFKMTNRISIKFEIGPFEQWYKFLENPKLENFEDVEAFLTDETFQHTKNVFDLMNTWYQAKGEELANGQ